MAISDTLKRAVEAGDITTIRSSFYTIILSDPEFRTNRFNEALNYVEKANITGLIDEHDGEELLPESEWNDEYYDLMASKLQDNFSKKRMAQLKTVAEKLSNLNRNISLEKFDFEENGTKSENKSNTIISSEEDNGDINNHNPSNSTNCRTTSTVTSSYDNWLILIGIISIALIIFFILRRILKGGK